MPPSGNKYYFRRMKRLFNLITNLISYALLRSDIGNETNGLQELRHIFHHGLDQYPRLHKRRDIRPGAKVYYGEDMLDAMMGKPEPSSFRVRTHPISIQRLVERSPERMETLMAAGREQGAPISLPPSAWTIDDIPGPNYTDKETVLSFARIVSNAYLPDSSDPEWVDVGGGFNYTDHFGWQEDGIRGHVFADKKNSTIVIGIKGTSPAVWDGRDTTTKDKLNDNLLFSCCCGYGSLSWRKVCDCMTSTYTCNSTCLVQSLKEKSTYYHAAQDLYHNISAMYPHAEIWLAGHSLGGSISSLIGLTYGRATVTFEAPGEAMPAYRLGLPTPPGYNLESGRRQPTTGGVHFGHTADPVFMGSCNAATSFCSIGGYAMESVCHTGKECVYDTVKDLGWRPGVGYHRIAYVIPNVYEFYDKVAACEPVVDCPEANCFNWKYFKSNSSVSTTVSKKSSTTFSFTRTTRTSICKTPGWWGCLDDDDGSTTSSSSRTKTRVSVVTSTTCISPGFFGCKESEITTYTTTIAAMRPTSAVVTSTTVAASSSTSCASPGLLWGCKKSVTAAPGKAIQSPATTAQPTLVPIVHGGL